MNALVERTANLIKTLLCRKPTVNTQNLNQSDFSILNLGFNSTSIIIVTANSSFKLKTKIYEELQEV